VTRRILAELRSAALLQSALAEALRGSDLTVDRWRCLAQVSEQPGASMTDLVDGLVMAPATASRAVDALVDSGLVFRSLDPADRRRTVLQVSPDGVAVLAAVEPRLPTGATEPAH